jgi:hypothetical protein
MERKDTLVTFQTFTPLEYLKIDVAGSFGLDKENWDTRIQWFDDHQEEIEKALALVLSKRDPRKTLIGKADNPAMFFAGIQAWDKARKGEPIGYGVSLDATASGAQILSILIGCEKSAAKCNVIDAGRRMDLYTEAYGSMLTVVGDSAKISRDNVKLAIMPSFYGSKKRPKEIFGTGTLLQVFEHVMETELPGIWELNKALLSMWQPDAYEHSWVLPDNFHVKVKVVDDDIHHVLFRNEPMQVKVKINRPTPEGRSISANVTHSVDGMVVREVSRRCSYDPKHMENLLDVLTNGKPLYQSRHEREKDKLVSILWNHYQKTAFLSARILENLDEENLWLVDQEVIKGLISTLPLKPFPVLSVHDCFRVHPNYGNDLRRQYNQILYELAKSDIAASIVSQITGEAYVTDKWGDIAPKILEANYALS